MKQRLDTYLAAQGLATTRSQAENLIGLGKVQVNKRVVTKSGHIVKANDSVEVRSVERYVSRAAYKLASVAQKLHLDFIDKVVLDVGSSTGGFTDYALQRGAKKVIAVDVGSEQLHPSLRNDNRIQLFEKTDIRDAMIEEVPDIVVVDVSFVSAVKLLPAILKLSDTRTDIIIMAKPQFEAASAGQLNKGIVKNSRIRRDIFKQFEAAVKRSCKIIDSMDSSVAGAKGNIERFYHLKKLSRPNR